MAKNAKSISETVKAIAEPEEHRKQMAAQAYAMGKRDALDQIVRLVEKQCAK